MRVRTALSVAAIVASGVYLGVRFLPGVFEGEPDYFALDPDEKAVLREARAAYAAFPVLAITETTTAADLQSVLDAAPEQPVPPPTPQIPGTLSPEEARRHRADLNRLMAEFLLYAFVKNDPEAYAAWRFGRKDRLMNMDEMRRVHYIGDAWLEFTGESMPESATSVQSYRLVARNFVTNAPPERRVVGVLDHPDAAFTRLYFVNPHLSTFSGGDPEPLGDLWSGAQSGGFTSYFTGGVRWDDLYEIPDAVLMARMGVIVVDAGGLRHPIFLNGIWDPAQGKWIIDHLGVGNHDPDRPLWILF